LQPALNFRIFRLASVRFEFKLQKQLFAVNASLRIQAVVVDCGTVTKFPELGCDLDVCWMRRYSLQSKAVYT